MSDFAFDDDALWMEGAMIGLNRSKSYGSPMREVEELNQESSVSADEQMDHVILDSDKEKAKSNGEH